MKNIEIRQKIYRLIEEYYYSAVSECVCFPAILKQMNILKMTLKKCLRGRAYVITKFGVATVLIVPAMSAAR